MDEKEFSLFINKSRDELATFLNKIREAPPDKEVVFFLIETIEEMIDVSEQSYCNLRERLMEFRRE